MGISPKAMPGLETALLCSRTLLLEQVVDAAGITLTNAGALRSGPGIRSTRIVERVLGLWTRRLTAKERILLARYGRGTKLDPEDPYPDLHLSPQLGEACGPLLVKAKDFNLCTDDKKTIHFNCVRVICKRRLNNRPWSV